ncbi:MAG: T9SS type A sorting domain-containing protein [Bacteroidia bacterium]
MKKIALLLLPVFVLFIPTASDAQMVKFRKVIGNTGYDQGMSAIQTLDTGYVAVGSTSSSGAGSTDVFFVKTDSMGVVKGNLTFGGANIDRATCVRQTADSGFVICGYSNSFGPGGYDIYVIKLNKYYQRVWEKAYGGDDWDFANAIRQTSDGGYIICGSTYSFGNGDQDFYLIKTDANGDTTWTKTFGGIKEDVARSVVQTSDGGYVVTGYTMSMGDLNGDCYTIRTDPAGDTLWTNRYGGSGVDKGNGVIEETTGGNIMIAGEATTGTNTDGTVIVLSPSGAYLTNYTFPSGPSYDNFNSISETPQGRFAMVGNTNSLGLNGDLQFLILDNTLNYFSSTTFGTIKNDYGYSAEPTMDKGYIICGTTNGFNNFLDDLYLIKTDSMGLANGTGSETFFYTGISGPVAETAENSLFYPNPAEDHIYIETDGNEKNALITVMDIAGKKLLERSADVFAGTPFYMEFPELSNGVYFITLSGKTVTTSKLIINK